MKRQKLNKSKDRQVFRNTQGVHSGNSLSGKQIARGGFRR